MKSNSHQIDPQEAVFNEVRASLLAIGLDEATVARLPIEVTPSKLNIEGDFGIPCFIVAKILHLTPSQAAHQLAEKLERLTRSSQNSLVAEYSCVGPYLNIKVDATKFATATIKNILQTGADYGRQNFGHGQKIIIDLSAPNIAKRMSVGHLRSTIIGDALAKVYGFCGFEVLKDNHLGDWGTQFGHLLYAIEQWGDEAAIEKNPIDELQKLYVKVSAAGEEDEKIKDAGRAWFKKL